MLTPLKYLTPLATVVVATLVACTGGGNPGTTTPAAANETAGVTSVAEPTAPPTAAARDPTPREPSAAAPGLDDYAAQVCTRTTDASDIAFARFLEAADDFAVARGDLAAEANSVADWALASAETWLAVADWSVTVEAPPALASFHAYLVDILSKMALDRARLAEEARETTDSSGAWILGQRAWAMTLLEPLPFIAASQSVRGPALAAFLVQPCEPLLISGSEVALSSDAGLSSYAAQTCWLHDLGWEQQQLNFQDLAGIPERAATLEDFRLGISEFTRQEERTQLLIGLGLQAIVPPRDLLGFHDQLSRNSTARLVAAFFGEEAVAAAPTAEGINAALNDLVFAFLAEAEALIAARDGAPRDLQSALAAHESCGALDGRELAFYQELTG